MANYKTHSTFNIFLALPALLVGIYYSLHPPYALLLTFVITFTYCTLFMSPDLDLVHNIKLVSLRGVLSLPFRLYSRVFKHRGLSHSFLFGSLTRIVWLAGMAFLVFFLICEVLPSKHSFMAYYGAYKYYIWYAGAAICLADWSHLLLDIKIQK
ncbi:MAG: hypothetical protein S4CHLAM2_13250 [Chlamydiales bacterium]|nr:hypothetical protein [Chlamydiales bacterium]